MSVTDPGSRPEHKRSSTKMASSQNLNEMLNFTLPPRREPPRAVPRRSRKTGTQVWNKERFVNAQYRFVVDPHGDYTVHFADPDIYFQWQDILQVILPRTSAQAAAGGGIHDDEITCPICLSPPTAARMTKCGHIFCFPCVLHLISTSEHHKWVRCPICFDSIHERHLKKVKWIDDVQTRRQLDIGASIRMRLVQRPHITTLALPRSPTWPSSLISPHSTPFHFLPDVYEFSKFMLATPDYLLGDLAQDMDELLAERRMLEAQRDELSLLFITSAETKIVSQIERAAALETPHLTEEVARARREHTASLARSQRRSASSDTDGTVPDALLATQPTSVTDALPRPRPRRNLNPPPPSTSTYYFYQSATGAPIFLHPLDIRILLSHFQSYDQFPDEMTVRVEAYSEGTVNDDLRKKRCKYLGHMPEGIDVIFVETDLSSVLDADALKSFEGPLRMRRQRRREKEKKEDKARVRAEEKEKGRVGLGPISARAVTVDYGPLPSPLLPPVEEPHPTVLHTPEITGVWGNRSFASALNASTTPARRAATPEIDDEWDIDAAWHELQQRNDGGGRGRRKRANKLVVLGGGRGRAR